MRYQTPLWLRACACSIAVITLGVHAQAPAWRPDKNVEIVVGTSPGGGQDSAARFVHRLIQERKLIDVASAVVNKPGAGSAIGYAYLNQQPGDAHYTMLLAVPLITNHLLGVSAISHVDLTPLANLFEEYIVAAVTPDSPIKSGQDLLARLRKDPQSVSVGVPSLTGGGNFAIVMAAKAAGADPRRLKTVVFKSGGDSMSALLGGHIDVMMSTTAAPVAQRRAGKVRILAIAAPKRVAGDLADVPTWRGMVGPRGLSAAQVAYWENVYRQVAANDDFAKEMHKNQWVANYLGSADMRKFLAAQASELKALMGELGMVK
ncbi:MAG: tripartite tricarboxylate transporter substrate binding protein [Betaproteobacteria bacterium]|nr:tripartite tricarboxylate transporter substrate binding protein [Betaproteobacteria bacterium]